MGLQTVQTLLPWLSPRPLTVVGAITPPLCYYFALVLLPSFHQSPPETKTFRSTPLAVCILRSVLAFWSFFTFLTLPFRYYVPVSSALTYQLGLIGWFGAGRVFELFVLVPLVPLRLPRHMRYQSDSPPVSPTYSSSLADTSNPLARTFKDMDAEPEAAGKPAVIGCWERAIWALDLMTAMRGVGWDWATADVRHTPLRWHPSAATQLYRLIRSLLPTLFLSLAGLRYLHPKPSQSLFDLPILEQATFVACLGIALYTLFDTSYTIMALLAGVVIPHMNLRNRKTIYNSLLSFPPLYTHALLEVCSLRDWWSRGWHRLFARYFLVYGVWPGHIVALAIMRIFRPVLPPGTMLTNSKSADSPPHKPRFDTHPYPRRTTTLLPPSSRPTCSGGEWGKVLGAFAISGVVHSIGERNALVHFTRTGWTYAGEFWFFVLNGVGVIIEEGVRRAVKKMREDKGGNRGKDRWYDGYVGKLWTLTVLLATGTLFADGWLKSGITWEITGGNIWSQVL
ncbi:hypothetical protein OE88DRAFT_1730346 [Heliocybe sulcata]|uniref:Wax synthase domain-containing protein n=1 Tax=Heliocybe sulcata TaxID=5364 RepID=A0A5C3NT43_9AGAM|nr:hypothetical protein OE88DRAFT_1730346 [Heliocybe sulcata]